jgi:hypothetical protein
MGYKKRKLAALTELYLKRQKHARYLYTIYNQRYFNGELQSIPVYVKPLKAKHWGVTHFEGGNPTMIILSPLLWADKRKLLTPTLLHEMVHVKLGEEEQCYGPGNKVSPAFKLETIRLSKLGALMDII